MDTGGDYLHLAAQGMNNREHLGAMEQYSHKQKTLTLPLCGMAHKKAPSEDGLSCHVYHCLVLVECVGDLF